jgi:hypothetical protein
MTSSAEQNSRDSFLFLPLSHLPYIIGLSYFLGFIVVAFRLRNYGIAPTDLFEAQYFSAGFFPTLILFTIYWIFRLTWRPCNVSAKFRGFLEYAYLKLFWGGVGIMALLWFVYASYHFKNEFWFALNYIASILFGVYALGVISYQLRRWWSTSEHPWLFYLRKPPPGLAGHLIVAGISLIYVIGFFTYSFAEIPNIYQQIPQALGGGKLIMIRLLVDTTNLPSDLKGDEISSATAYTKPLWLVFHSRWGYVVIDEHDRPSAIPSEAVHSFTPIMNGQP